MARNPVVLIHGYSDEGASFRVWERILEERGYDVAMIHACTYRSLTNEVSIKDIAEGFDRALRIRSGLDADEPFDAIVHSTGMLVIRAWLTVYAGRRDRLKHLHRVWRRRPSARHSPTRDAAGLARCSRATATSAPISSRPATGFSTASSSVAATPGIWRISTCSATRRSTVQPDERLTCSSSPATRVMADCGNCSTSRAPTALSGGHSRPLNTRKIVLDLTRDPEREGSEKRISVADWKNIDIPLIPIDGKNHGSILTDPGDELADLVDSALQVSSAPTFTQWIDDATKRTQKARRKDG